MKSIYIAFVALLGLGVVPAAYAAAAESVPMLQVQPPAPAKPKEVHGAVAIGITNAENFDYHWSALSVSSYNPDKDKAIDNALRKCNSQVHANRPQDGCVIIDTWNSTDQPRTCRFGISAKSEYQAFIVVRPKASEVWQACKQAGGLNCSPRLIKGGCIK